MISLSQGHYSGSTYPSGCSANIKDRLLCLMHIAGHQEPRDKQQVRPELSLGDEAGGMLPTDGSYFS